MCGIVAQYSLTNRKPESSLIKKMAKDIHHRGPDDEGYFYGDWFNLGFKRLSILDLSKAGHQPMLDESKSFVLIFNGEIYNYKALRAILLVKGYSFFSNSDTEVVLKSFIEWGDECFSKFEGMFAINICNLKTHEVTVARDQLGIKPLYYLRDNDNILFSSEIKAFRNYQNFLLNSEKIYEQFQFRYVAGEETLFKNVKRVKPGTIIKIRRDGRITEDKYYDVLDSLEKSERKSIDIEYIEELLKSSIKAHTQSDVGYNIQLSGGLDSSYTTAVLTKEYAQKVHTFSVEVSGFDKDESQYQKMVSEQFQTYHHGHSLSGYDFAENIEKATWHMDLPIVHGAGVFLMMLCEHSEKNSKVILTGEGADELFGGYSRYSIPRKIKIIYWLKSQGYVGRGLPEIYKFKGLKTHLNHDFGLKEQIFHDENKMDALLTSIPKQINFRKEVSGRFDDLLRKIIASDQTSYLQSLLERQDKFAMAQSVETRVPFCTSKLFDYVNNLDYNDKIKNEPKKILKKIAQKYFGNDFIYRKKVGFVLPYADWMRDRKKTGRFFDLLTDDTFKSREFYNHKAIEKLVDEHLYQKKDHSKFLSKFINF